MHILHGDFTSTNIYVNTRFYLVLWSAYMSRDFDSLKSFHLLAECLSYGIAATNLNIDQTTLSRRIIKLESEIGFKLFSRGKGQISLTNSGSRFYDQTRKIVQDYNKSVIDAKLLSSSNFSSLKIGYMAFAAMEIAPKHIAHFQKKYPKIIVKLRYLNSQNQLAALENGEIDIGYIIGPIKNKNFIEISVAKERLVVLCAKDHKFKTLTEIPPTLLADQALILGDLIEWNIFRWRLEDMFEKHGVNLDVSLEATSTLAILGLVSAGLGLTIYPESIMNFIKNEDLIARPLHGDNFSIMTSVICQKNYKTSEVKSFIESLE